jgi:hypothetical protein
MNLAMHEEIQRLADAVRTKQYELAEEWAGRHITHDAERVRVLGDPTLVRFDCWTCGVTFTVAIQTNIDWLQNANTTISVIPSEGPIARVGPRL